MKAQKVQSVARPSTAEVAVAHFQVEVEAIADRDREAQTVVTIVQQVQALEKAAQNLEPVLLAVDQALETRVASNLIRDRQTKALIAILTAMPLIISKVIDICEQVPVRIIITTTIACIRVEIMRLVAIDHDLQEMEKCVVLHYNNLIVFTKLIDRVENILLAMETTRPIITISTKFPTKIRLLSCITTTITQIRKEVEVIHACLWLKPETT